MKLNLIIKKPWFNKSSKIYHWLIVIFLLLPWNSLFAQETEYVIYRWEDVLNANPDTIYGLSFSKEKRTELPMELTRFSHLRLLDISKNKFTFLPDLLDSLKNLEVLIASKNDFTVFPLILTRLSKLKKIIINRNNIEQIPDLIQNCKSLQNLDLSDNPIGSVPVSFFSLEQLKVVDFTGVRFGPRYQTYIKNMRPDINWILDPPCDCME